MRGVARWNEVIASTNERYIVEAELFRHGGREQMAFHSQLGRFGDLAQTLTGTTDFDQHAANIISQNGHIHGGRPTLVQTLGSKGAWDPKDPTWVAWTAVFGARRNTHIGNGGGPLQPNCPRSPPGFPYLVSERYDVTYRHRGACAVFILLTSRGKS